MHRPHLLNFVSLGQAVYTRYYYQTEVESMIENELRLRGAASRLNRVISYDVRMPLPKVGYSTPTLKNSDMRRIPKITPVVTILI